MCTGMVLMVIAEGYAQTCTKISWANMNLAGNTESMVGQSWLNGTTLYTWNTYEKEYCKLMSTSPLNGICYSNATHYEFFPMEISFPGERWDPKRAFYECGYGYKVCSAFRWIGFLQNEICTMHEDCNPGLYWDSSTSTCQKVKDLGIQCKSSPECGRTAACIYLNSADANGKCVEYYTIEDNTSIYAKTEEDTFVCASGYAWLSSVSGVYEYKVGADFQAGAYVWGKSVVSENAGIECTTNTDCKTSVSGVYAKCGCSSGSSLMFWGILTGNTEWKEYFTAVQTYYKNTKDCHNARNFDGVCTQDELNNEKMCKKLIAKNYLAYTNAPECVKLYSNRYLYPDVDEVEYWWNIDRKYTLLGINSASLLSLSTLALTFIASIAYFLI